MNLFKWICYAVGYVFITSGVMKLLDPEFQSTFNHLGIPFPGTMLFVIAIVEVACGMLLLGRMYVKQASSALIVIIVGAIYLTKVPVFNAQGILAFAFDARLDIVMLILLTLLWITKKETY